MKITKEWTEEGVVKEMAARGPARLVKHHNRCYNKMLDYGTLLAHTYSAALSWTEGEPADNILDHIFSILQEYADEQNGN